jgi:hypothetical protein
MSALKLRYVAQANPLPIRTANDSKAARICPPKATVVSAFGLRRFR